MIALRGRMLPAVVVLGAALVIAGCGKAEDAGDTNSGANPDTSQQVKSSGPSGGTCTLQQFGGQKLDLKTAKVGFSQSEKEANPFRIAETQSIRDEAAKLGITNLQVTNADSKFSKQIADVEQMIDSGVQLLVIAPLNSDGWDPVFQKAAAKKVPIVTIDRKINAKHCTDYLTFIGSDFYEQGKRAAQKMAKALDNKGTVAILLGAPGNNVTTQRTAGFKDEIAKVAPNIKIDFEQTGNFSREEGQKVAENLIQSKPGINGIYAENDEMALGAVTALKGAGKKAGDVKIVSIDGTRGAVQGIVDGWLYSVIESNPRFGPLAFSTAQKFFNGDTISENIIISDREYDQANAKDNLSAAY
jgi:galactofuranose transport system substrate-binding protein